MASIPSAMCREIRQRIIRVYLVQRRWLGYYQVMYYARLNRRARLAYPRVVALMVGRGELIYSHDDDNGFWRYLWTGAMRLPAEPCALEAFGREGTGR